jgi:hypothetical protein
VDGAFRAGAAFLGAAFRVGFFVGLFARFFTLAAFGAVRLTAFFFDLVGATPRDARVFVRALLVVFDPRADLFDAFFFMGPHASRSCEQTPASVCSRLSSPAQSLNVSVNDPQVGAPEAR